MPSLRRTVSFKELTASGVLGDARRASAAKGEALLQACAQKPRRAAAGRQALVLRQQNLTGWT
jgi:creatinine amidohydrolase/Fe(II)-dependent formamide hydrolase-like protein